MFELIKLAWHFIVLREAAHRGQLKLRVWVLAGAFLVIVYGIGLPVTLYYVNHPNFLPLLIAAVVLVVAAFIVMAWLGISWWREGMRDPSPKND